VTFSGTLTNTTPGPIFLNDISFTLGSGGLSFDRTPFVVNHPATLAPGQSFTGNLFNLAVGGGVANGTYTGYFSVIGGDSATAQTLLASQAFTLKVLNGSTTAGGGSCIPGMLAWYKAENNPNDSVGSNHGTLQNGATFAAGKVGQAFKFNGSGEVTVPNNPTLNVQQLTIDAWVNPAQLGSGDVDVIVNKETDSNSGVQYEIGVRTNSDPGGSIPAGNFAFYVGGQSGLPGEWRGWVDGGATVPLNVWSHVALTFDGSTVKTYVNGQLKRTISELGGTIATTTGPFKIGARSGTGARFNGLIDEVDLFNRALSQTEIQTIYNAGSTGKCLPGNCDSSRLISWYQAEGNANDSVGSNNGNLRNGVTFVPGQVGQAFNFAGNDAQVEIPSNSSINFTTAQDYAVEFFMKSAQQSNMQGTLVEKWSEPSTAPYPYVVRMYGTTAGGNLLPGTIECAAFDGSVAAIVVSTKAVDDNNWHQVRCNFRHSQKKVEVYLDGQLDGSSTYVALNNISNDRSLFFGVRGGRGPDVDYDGLLDEVKIYELSSGNCAEVCTPLPANSVSWFSAEGNANDSVGSNNGAFQNGVTFAPGKVGQAFSFDGSGEVSVLSQPSLNVQQLAIDAWVFPTSYGSGEVKYIVSKELDNSNQVQYEFAINNSYDTIPNGNLIYYLAGVNGLPNDGHSWVNAGGSVPLNTWTHVALTFDGSTAKTYLNGELKRTVTNLTGNVSTSSNPLRIGSGGQPTQRFVGEIDEVDLFNRALCDSEIRAIYDGGSKGKCNSTGLRVISAPTNQSVFGQPVSFTATLPYAGSRAPAGTMTFKDGNATIGTAALGVSGTAVFTTAGLAVGAHAITVAYNGDASCNELNTPVLPLVVNKADTATAVTSIVNPSVNTQSANFKAVVSPTAPGAGVATGNIVFKDGVTTLGTVNLDASGQALYSSSSLTTGSRSITATFSGDAKFNASTSAPLTQNVSGGADLAIAMSGAPGSTSAGATISYTIIATNKGPEGSDNAALYDLLPAGSVFVSVTPSSANCQADGFGLACALGHLDSGASVSLTLTAKLFVVGANTNAASVSGGLVELNTGADNAASQTTNVSADATLQFSAANYNVTEGCASAGLTVTRTGNIAEPASVEFHTSDSAALQRTDYSIASGTLRFASGESSKNLIVLVNEDNYVEGDETAIVTLESVKPGGTAKLGLGAPFTASFTIKDNDTVPPSSNVIETAQSFVCQHYHDFLSREPDQGGLQYWTQQITNCGGDGVCVSQKRREVSNAFFVEQEFQKTGSFVYRLYKTAYGDTVPNHGYRPTYQQFAPDRARINPESTVLAQSLQDLAGLLVQRADFIAKYPTTLTGPQFVDAILATVQAGSSVNLQSQRDVLVSEFTAGGRGRVLYRLADDNAQSPINNREFLDAEYDRAFVLTEYFGYLRRDPDQGGYDFWLNVVNSFPLRDLRGQNAMVCAFITSGEYQQRFSSITPRSNGECAQ
jgi:uncharacterized repeat protein (TIGR01451 family)